MYGAKVHLSPGDQGTNGAIRVAAEMAESRSKYLMLNQYENEANPVHTRTVPRRRSSATCPRSTCSSPDSAPAARSRASDTD